MAHTRLHDDEVVAGYSSQSGEDYNSTTLINMPSITVGLGFQGGQTVVRCDIREVHREIDMGGGATEDSEVAYIWRRFYSPQIAVYHIGQEMTQEALEGLGSWAWPKSFTP